MEARYRFPSDVNPQAQMAELIIEGENVPLCSRYSLRFLRRPGCGPLPILCYDGRRVIRPWSLQVRHSEPGTEWGMLINKRND